MRALARIVGNSIREPIHPSIEGSMMEQQSSRLSVLVCSHPMRRAVSTGRGKSSTQSKAGYLAGVLALAAFSIAPAAAQQARWYQLSEQVLQLREHGKIPRKPFRWVKKWCGLPRQLTGKMIALSLCQ